MRLSRATPQQIRYACLHYHYAKSVPSVQVGYACYDDNVFIGVILFGSGANNNAAKSFGLVQGQVLELVRVALNGYQQMPTSKYVACALRLLHKDKPLVKIVISYADLTNQEHYGTIYQATNWLFLGKRTTANKGAYYKINGRVVHGRSARAKYGHERNFPKGWEHVKSMTKFLYVYPLTKDMRLRLSSKALSYPLREGGAIPTKPHQEAIQ